MTLAADSRRGSTPRRSGAEPPPSDPLANQPPNQPPSQPPVRPSERPVEFWSTAAIRSALQSGDIATWQQIVVALKRDPYGRTARQVEEVLEGTPPFGIAKALSEVMSRARTHLEANERAEVARHMRLLITRSGLSQQEFASRIGVPLEDLAYYLEAEVSPPATLLIRMRRLSDRFVKMRADRPAATD